VKYCNAACKKKHRYKHKKDCKEYVRLAAEQASKLHDEKLFKQSPPSENDDCPICFLRLPSLDTGWRYQSCCGKLICSGCIYAPVYDNQGNEVDNKKCPFCRVPTPTKEEMNSRIKKRIDAGDAIAIFNHGGYYRDGKNGLKQDYKKALELCYRAAELGYAKAYNNIGYAYDVGRGVEIDNKKANHYYELSAMMGCVEARFNLGEMEEKSGNLERALKHYMLAVKDGFTESLKQIYNYSTQMGMQQKTITQHHYNPINHTWKRLRVNRGTKLLLYERIIVIIRIGRDKVYQQKIIRMFVWHQWRLLTKVSWD